MTEIPNLDIPKNLGTPKLGAVERTVHVELTRAHGWHYDKDRMIFIPAYSESRGVKMPFELTLVSTKGYIIKFNSQLFNNSIPLTTFLKICFPTVTRDLLLSSTMLSTKYTSRYYFNVPNKDSVELVKSVLNPKSNIDPYSAVDRFRLLFTTQTQIENNTRLPILVSLKYFLGCCLLENTIVYDGIVSKSTPLAEHDLFRLEHSGISMLELVSKKGETFTVPLLLSLYTNLNLIGRSITSDEKRYILSQESHSKPITLDNTTFPSVSIPKINTLQIYCIMLNRLEVLKLVDANINMNSYDNQTLSTLYDSVEQYNSADTAILDDRILSSPNMLSGVSSVVFDKTRIKRDISGENSSLVVLTNNENPFALLASSGNSKVTKAVSHLPREAIKIQEGTLGILDGTDVFENTNIGKSTPVSITTKIENQKLYTPLYVVKDGVVTEEVVYVESTRVNDLVVAEYNVNLSDKYILARVDGVTRYVSAYSVTHTRVSPFSSTSICRANAIYAQHGDLKRSQMAGKTMEQARNILLPERAMVETGIESVALNFNPDVKFQATVKDIIEKYILLENLIIPEGIESHEFTLELLKQTSEENMYQLISVKDSDIIGIFNLENKKTSKGSCTWNNIVPPIGVYYKYNDFVYADNTVIKTDKPVEGVESLKFHSNGNEDYFDYGIGCGKNLKVMFGFYHTFTVDDASIVSDRLIRDMSMHTPTIFVRKYQLKKPMANEIEEFGFSNGVVAKGFESDGLPKIGTIIYPNEPVIYKYIRNQASWEVTINNSKMPYDMCGEVFKVVKNENEIIITFYNVVKLNMGDKLSGRLGNKTTIAKIIPMEQMFYDYETGEPVDMVLNPLSTCSRMNLGQIPELFVSAKQKHDNKGISIAPLFEPVFEDCIQQYFDNKDIVSRTMIDGETGIPLANKMYVGYMNILRSVHISEDKTRAIGDSTELDPAFLQPVGQGEKNQRGQSVDAMVIDLLVALGCYDLINDIKGLMSSDVFTYQNVMGKLQKEGIHTKIDVVSNSIQSKHLLMMTLSLYVKIMQESDLFQLTFANDEIIEKFRQLNLKNIKSDIIDKNMCKEMSYFRMNTEIITPVAIKKFNCLSTISVFKLQRYVYEITGLSSALCDDIINELAHCEYKYNTACNMSMYYISKDRSSTSITGMNALIKIARTYTYEDIVTLLEFRSNAKLEKTGTFDAKLKEQILYAQHIEDTGGYNQFISLCVPVMPLKYRVSSNDARVLHDITRGYLKVASLCELNSNSNQYLKSIYDALFKVLLSTDSEYKSVFEFLFKKDKDGRVRNKMLKTRVKNSARGNIAPASYSHPNYIGLPVTFAIYIFQAYVNNVILSRFKWIEEYTNSPIEVSEYLSSLFYLPLTKVKEVTGGNIRNQKQLTDLFKAIEYACKEGLVYYYRAPALHETSLWGARVYLTRGSAIRIPTLITSEQNADFDGDAEAVAAVFTEKARNDIETRLLPSSRLRRSNDGAVSLRINQDSLLGLYLLTSSEINADNPIVYININQVFNHIEQQILNPSQVIYISLDGKLIKGTAGRLVASNVINKLSVSDKDSDGLFKPYITKIITSNANDDEKISISSITLDIVKNHTGVESTEIISNLQSLGYYMNHLINMTLSLEDFIPILNITDPSKLFIEHLEYIMELEPYGLLPSTWMFDFDREFINYKNSIDIMKTLGKDNAFYKMVDSGARGKESQLHKMFTLIGFMKGNNSLLPTPALTSFIRGVSQFQSEDSSYEQRANALSTVHETSDPGVALRTGSYELGSLFVNKDSLKSSSRFPHKIFYTPEVDINKYILLDSNGVQIDNSEIKNLSFKGHTINGLILNQLSKHPAGIAELDNSYIIKFDKNVDPIFDEIVRTKTPNDKAKEVIISIKKHELYCNLRTFINYFEDESGISQDYVFVNSAGTYKLGVGTQLGSKSATSSSEPGSQMVISRRNLVAADSSYSGLEIFQNAIQYGKIYGNDRNSITYLAPENGTIKITIYDNGTRIILIGDSGYIYHLNIDVDSELTHQILVYNEDFVFATQPIIGIKGYLPEERIHPTLSLTWDTVEIDNVTYKTILPNTSEDIVQYSRFVYFKFLLNLYRDSGISLDIIHYSSYALQQLRTATIVRNDTLNLNHYMEVSKCFSSNTKNYIYDFQLLNGKKTILSTSGALSTYIYQDPMSAVIQSLKNGKTKEQGHTSKLILGIPVNSAIDKTIINYNPKDGFNRDGTPNLYSQEVNVISDLILEDEEEDDNSENTIDMSSFLNDLGITEDAEEDTEIEHKDNTIDILVESNIFKR